MFNRNSQQCDVTIWCTPLSFAEAFLPGLGELKVPDGHLGGTAGSLESWHGENHQGKRREIPSKATDSACASESGGTQLRLGGAGREWDAWIWDSMVLWPIPFRLPFFFSTGGLFDGHLKGHTWTWTNSSYRWRIFHMDPHGHKDKGELLIRLACPRQSLNMS